MNNLAVSYRTLGRQEGALVLEEDDLQLRRHILGTDHTDDMISMHNLAISYEHPHVYPSSHMS